MRSLDAPLRLWGLVLAGNLLAGALFALFLSWFGPAKGIISEVALTHIAAKYIDMSFITVLSSALLAGWMMGLLGWLMSSVQDSISRIVLIILVTVIIGYAELHHCVVGSLEVIAAMLVDEHIGLTDYWHFLWPSVLGNLIGGALFVSVLKFGVSQRRS